MIEKENFYNSRWWQHKQNRNKVNRIVNQRQPLTLIAKIADDGYLNLKNLRLLKIFGDDHRSFQRNKIQTLHADEIGDHFQYFCSVPCFINTH